MKIGQQDRRGTPLTQNAISPPTPRAALLDIRRRTGLSQDRIAALLGVTPRAVYLWLNGAVPSPVDEQRILQRAKTIRWIDCGTPARTRAALMSWSPPDHLSLFDRIASGALVLSEDVLSQESAGLSRTDRRADRHGTRPRPALDPAERAARKPPPLAAALSDQPEPVAERPGRGRLARPVRRTKPGG